MADELEGTAGADAAGDQDQSSGTQQLEQPGATSTSGQPAESFINPADLPPELKPHWSRMHRAYTKALERTRQAGEKAALVDRFWSDDDFARESIRQWAQQRGVALSFGDGSRGAGAPTDGAGATANVPPDFLAAIEAELPQEIRWMARPLAASVWRAQGHLIAPLIRDSQQREASARSSEYDDLRDELSETAPGWEAHEDDMSALLEFLRSRDMRSRRWGSKLQLLHAIVTGNATATAAAVRRIGEAGRNRMTTGVPGRAVTPNIDERVRGAKSDQEAWQLAAQHAMEELKRTGAVR